MSERCGGYTVVYDESSALRGLGFGELDCRQGSGLGQFMLRGLHEFLLS